MAMLNFFYILVLCLKFKDNASMIRLIILFVKIYWKSNLKKNLLWQKQQEKWHFAIARFRYIQSSLWV